MCIVSIFSGEGNDFLLTHNRDESNLRPTSDKIFTDTVYGHKYTGPKDLASGGTWVYYSDEFACCVLNGGYEKHAHRPPYRMSRGLLILELLKYPSINKFTNDIDLKGIEPFTMIMINRKSTEKKILVWDEKEKHIENPTGEKLIVRSSSPLYTQEEKERHFRAFQDLTEVNPDSVFKLHDELKMLENEKIPTLQTTSITSVYQVKGEINMKFCPIIG